MFFGEHWKNSQGYNMPDLSVLLFGAILAYKLLPISQNKSQIIFNDLIWHYPPQLFRSFVILQDDKKELLL